MESPELYIQLSETLYVYVFCLLGPLPNENTKIL
jgi:hypothetical protein